ncbi:MAG: ABC transporter substrate-binding protein, partial [Chloroflexota bacterium]
MIETSQWTLSSLDAHTNTQAMGRSAYLALYSGLVRFDMERDSTGTKQIKLVGDLAESWEQPDPKTIIFHLKKGVTFHDGSAFDASVAVWNVLRGRDNPKSILKTILEPLDTAEAVDANTLRLKLKQNN